MKMELVQILGRGIFSMVEIGRWVRDTDFSLRLLERLGSAPCQKSGAGDWCGLANMSQVVTRVLTLTGSSWQDTSCTKLHKLYQGCPMNYPTLPIGFHWAPLGGSW